jgi:hypoxanthine phosphoribosyltransferase
LQVISFLALSSQSEKKTDIFSPQLHGLFCILLNIRILQCRKSFVGFDDILQRCGNKIFLEMICTFTFSRPILILNSKRMAEPNSKNPRRSPKIFKKSALPLVPWSSEIRSVLISEERIARRVNSLARQIQKDFAGRDLVIVAILTGTVMFLADLLRRLSLPLHLDFIGVSSYGSGDTPGELVFTKELRLDVRGRDVLLIDDILDTGGTLSRVLPKLRQLQPRCIKVCVLLDKKERRVEKIEADYVGFTIPNEFVVGYGLDYGEKYRNLPYVGLLQSEILPGAAAKEKVDVKG